MGLDPGEKKEQLIARSTFMTKIILKAYTYFKHSVYHFDCFPMGNHRISRINHRITKIK